MGVTSGIATGRVLRNKPLKAIPGQTPKESSVTHATLAIQRQLHAVRVGNNIAVVAGAPVARIFSEFGMRFEIIRAPVVAIFELVRVVEQRVLAPIDVKDRRRVGHAKQQGGTGGSVDDSMPGVQRW